MHWIFVVMLVLEACFFTIGFFVTLFEGMFRSSGDGDAFKVMIVGALVLFGTYQIGHRISGPKQVRATVVATESSAANSSNETEVDAATRGKSLILAIEREVQPKYIIWPLILIALVSAGFAVFSESRDYDSGVILLLASIIGLHLSNSVNFFPGLIEEYTLSNVAATLLGLFLAGATLLILFDHPHYAAGFGLTALFVCSACGIIDPLGWIYNHPKASLGLALVYPFGAIVGALFHWHLILKKDSEDKYRKVQDWRRNQGIVGEQIPEDKMPIFAAYAKRFSLAKEHNIDLGEHAGQLWASALYWIFRVFTRIGTWFPEAIAIVLMKLAPLMESLTKGERQRLQELGSIGNDADN